jgi:hypothetical protein
MLQHESPPNEPLACILPRCLHNLSFTGFSPRLKTPEFLMKKEISDQTPNE